MHDLNVIRQLLVKLLSSRSPELGARLKQRLIAEFIDSGLGHFDEKAYGYRRFKDFLARALGDVLSVEQDESSGDILVSVRAGLTLGASAVSPTLPPVAERPPVVRSDVWQGFSNPDPKRKRFLQKSTMAIRHFLLDESSPARREVEAAPNDYLELEVIPGQVQIQWMKDFIQALRIPANEKAALEALANEPYSSAVNATFTRALGDQQGAAWRNFRTRHIISKIKEWADSHHIKFATLCAHPVSGEPPAPPRTTAHQPFTAREQAIRLLDLLSDEDIARLVVPTLLSAILIRSRA